MKHMLSMCLFVIMLLLVPYALAAESDQQDVQTLFLGSYEQDENAENGEEPIEWIVLETLEGRSLLVSRYALECLPYHESKGDIIWADSTLRAWLNDSFLITAFTLPEQAAILTTALPNDLGSGNIEWTVSGGAATEDRVFLLSYQEATQYFSLPENRKLSGTTYARGKGAKFLGLVSVGIAETDWWLRSPGRVAYDGCYVDVFGQIGTRSAADKQGVRPAIWLDTTADSAAFSYETYHRAEEAYEAGAYAEAADLFASLGTYFASVEKATECRYAHACGAQEACEWDTAIAVFDALGDYLDSYQRGRACRYAQAVEVQASGDIDGAIQLFTELGQYEDSMARLISCFNRKGTSMYYFADNAFNAGTDTGYSKANTITINDPHFGWSLGRFLMTDFTRVTENTDNPIFIKTLGDTLTLWFDLKQDIEALNGSMYLSINQDQNGYDQYFGVQRTDFGRGTLIIQHTDYQNNKSDPQIYMNYILAKGTTSANTRIELAEEGDYEVALNYEIADSDIAHAFKKFNNYRIFFRFSIRNGNCMVFPFDVGTRKELTDTSITANGFSLDLARSRYLDINVQRSVITKGVAGITEDIRFNRPAKDGDQYIQEGIYTITVSNRYTGETTTKTLFVGTDELLQQYIELGFSMDRLN